MSRRVDREAVDEITLANGDKVWVRQRLTGTEQAELSGLLMHLKVDPESEQVTVEEGDWRFGRVRLCQVYVVRWNFKEDDGSEMPCTREVIAELDDDTIQEISAGIDRLRKERKALQEKKG